MYATVRILPGATADSGYALCPPVLVQIDNKRYIFNTPEGTTRNFSQRRIGGMGPNNEGAIFLPAVTSSVMGGLHGLMMGVGDSNAHSADRSGRDVLKIVGPPDLQFAIAVQRTSNRRSTLALNVIEASSNPTVEEEIVHSDGAITVFATKIWSSTYSEDLPENIFSTESESDGSDAEPGKAAGSSSKARPARPDGWRYDPARHGAGSPRKNFPNYWLDQNEARAYVQAAVNEMYHNASSRQVDEDAKAAQDQLAPTAGDFLGDLPMESVWQLPTAGLLDKSKFSTGNPPITMAYILQTAPLRGKVDMAKATELGIPPGPMLGQLSAGGKIEIERPVKWAEWSSEQRSKWIGEMKKRDALARPQRKWEQQQQQKKKQKPKEAAAPAESAAAQETSAFANEPTEKVTVMSDMVVGKPRPGYVSTLQQSRFGTTSADASGIRSSPKSTFPTRAIFHHYLPTRRSSAIRAKRRLARRISPSFCTAFPPKCSTTRTTAPGWRRSRRQSTTSSQARNSLPTCLITLLRHWRK